MCRVSVLVYDGKHILIADHFIDMLTESIIGSYQALR